MDIDVRNKEIVMQDKLRRLCNDLMVEHETYNGILVKQAQACVVENKSDYEVASAFLANIKDRLKSAESDFKKIKQVLDGTKKIVLEYEKLTKQDLEKAEKYLKACMSDFYAKEMEEKRKVMEKLRDQGVVDKVVETKPELTGASMRKSWYFEINDKTQLPIEYLEPNTTALNAVARDQKENTNIPGGVAKYKLIPVS